MPRDTPVIHPGWASSVDDVLEQTRPTEVQVRRRSSTSDGAGGRTVTWSNVATVMGRLSPVGAFASEGEIAERLTGKNAWTWALPAGTDVRSADQITFGSRFFEVVAAQGLPANETERRVFATEVGG